MSGSQYNFQYCQKLVVFSEGWSKVLLARRFGEADYDGTFALIGGKIKLNPEEYSEYRWVAVVELADFEPKIKNIPAVVDWALAQKTAFPSELPVIL